MKQLFKVFFCVAICAIFPGCAMVNSSTKSVSGLLPRPGAKIILSNISNASNQAFEVDVEAMLRDAITLSLQKENIFSSGGQRTQDFVLSLQITDYRPGNAFKRWLMPWYGSSILAVRGDLRDAQNNFLVVSIDHQRSVVAGGVYSIGAWKTIFASVADDIAHDLKLRIEQGGEFVIDLPPLSDRANAVEPDRNSISIRLVAMNDRRSEPGRIGERYAAFGVSMGDVYFSRNVPEFLRQSLADEFLIMGHGIVDSGEDIRVTGEVQKFWVTTNTTPLYWDIIGEIQLGLLVEPAHASTGNPIIRSYSCKKTERTFVWPTSSLMGKVMDSCQEELWSKIRSDNVWTSGVPAVQ